MSESWDFDCIVVGSGFAGSVTACRLSEVGERVCILERGRRYLPSDLPVVSGPGPDATDDAGDEPLLPDFARAFWGLGHGLWDLRDLGDLVVGQAAGFGGGSLIYANVHLRAPEAAFSHWPEPFNRATLDPCYDLAAWMLGVQPMPETYAKTAGLEGAARKLGLPYFRPPLAIRFAGEGEAGGCDMQGECLFGCRREAKNTLDRNYLERAEQQGTEVRTLAEVFSIQTTERAGRRGYQVEYRDHLAKGRIKMLSAPNVFLCAGAVNTTELLLKSRQAGLPIDGEYLGTRFHPNADAVGVVFDCDEMQELDRGPTITSSLVYDDGEDWLLLQDGGMSTGMEPILGVFRSPLWLHRNGFSSKPPGSGTSQRVGYAELPFQSLLDAVSSVTVSAIAPSMPLAHEVSQAFLAFGRGRRELDAAEREWKAYPSQLGAALNEIRDRSLGNVAGLAEPVLERLLERTVENIAPELDALLRSSGGDVDLGGIGAEDITAWAFRIGLQLLWGSQAGLVGALAQELRNHALPEGVAVPSLAGHLLRWALDYRLGDGHTAVLLSMGRDSAPWRLELAEAEHPAPGIRIEGDRSQAAGIVVGRADGELVVAELSGRFEPGETLLADGRAFGSCGDRNTERAGGLRLARLLVEPLAFRSELDPRRFRPDRYRSGRLEAPDPGLAVPPERPVRAVAPRPGAWPERAKQECLMRDVAGALGGELRTDPLWSVLGRRVTVHPQGGCPMAEERAHGVTDPFGMVFGCPGLYVMDAAAFPTPVGVNPSATIAAVAEYKVAQFINGRREADGQREPWRPADLAEAQDWAQARQAALDPPELAGAGEASLQNEPIGIEFSEVMKGTHRAYDEPDFESEIRSELNVEIPDLASFLEEGRRGGRPQMRIGRDSRLWIAGIPEIPEGAVEVCQETSHLRVSAGRDESGAEWRTLEYLLEFEVDGRRYVLDGIKDIRDEERFDLWEDTTTLTFTLAREGRAPFGCGVLRLPAAEFFGEQLGSFKATHTGGDPVREAWALFSFARFFFANMVDVYLPALGRIGDAARSTWRGGHV